MAQMHSLLHSSRVGCINLGEAHRSKSRRCTSMPHRSFVRGNCRVAGRSCIGFRIYAGSGSLQYDACRPSHDHLDHLFVPKEQYDILSKQLEKINWALYLEDRTESDVQADQQALPPLSSTDYVYHFAYGANMNFYTLNKRGVKAYSRDPAKVANDRMRLVFRHRGGYGTLEEVNSDSEVKFCPFISQVHGVLYKISKEDLRKLEKKEIGYVLKEMEVETYDNRTATAWVFISDRFSKLAEEVSPTERYMRTLREGASDNYLDPVYQAWLSGIDTVPSAGLPSEYFNTPSKYLAYGFLCIVACIGSGFFFQW